MLHRGLVKPLPIPGIWEANPVGLVPASASCQDLAPYFCCFSDLDLIAIYRINSETG